ncbi:hypothetical protein FQA39_LY09494 [Lamprigera yunnana]|nr:hypothetical protein FQA39_LY09494 [Lamprigera yunnana]
MLQRQLKKREMDSANVEVVVSPKKTRLSYKATLNHKKVQCVYCEKYEREGEQIYRVSSANCGKNLFEWALQFQNWEVHARLNTAINAEDVQASNIHYHASCYTKLKPEAPADTTRSTFHQQTYDPLIIAQLLALVKYNNSPQKVSQMKKWYKNRLDAEKSDWLHTIAPFVDEYAGNVFIPGINNALTISGIEKNDELWMAERHWLQHLNIVVKDNDGQLQETPLTYSGFFLHGQNSKDVRRRSTVGVFPILYQKSATIAMQKHCISATRDIMFAPDIDNVAELEELTACFEDEEGA